MRSGFFFGYLARTEVWASMYNNCWKPTCSGKKPDDLATLLHQEARVRELIIKQQIEEKREEKETERLKKKEKSKRDDDE
ncbi:unnamed protein product [Phyllotreta striolata]|uniref:Uncharacterized protein n=1 Tax=Phyllotreta striolata TaxID=444603 RepID=A0A9N9TJ77_PHYSR|nr:unnamed protein product [Phyllotreta striolata]